MPSRKLWLSCSKLVLGSIVFCAASSWSQLRVGAAKVDVTPDPLFAPYTSVHDRLFTRAILVENGSTSALLMNLDVGSIPQDFYDKVSQEISSRYSLPPENILISATHEHTSVQNFGAFPYVGLSAGNSKLGGYQPGAASTSGQSPALEAYVAQVYRDMLQAVQEAKAALQPAEMGFGEGELYLNANRDGIDPKTRLWVQTPNPDYPSDRTLAVLEFRKPNGGDPIAIYMNYDMHPMTLFLFPQISSDFPGAASHYIEDLYDNKVVAEWSMGAGGDQIPLYMRPIVAASEPRIQDEMDASKPDNAGKSEYSAAITRLMFGLEKNPEKPVDPKLAARNYQLIETQGQLMAEEALRVVSGIAHFSTAAAIQGSSQVLACPGRKRLDDAREGTPGRYEDAPPVKINLGALRIGDVAFGRTNAELYTKIGMELKAGSPFRYTLVVNLADGDSGSGYVPTDDAYGRYSRQVLGSRLKPGCGEMGVVNGIDGMLQKYSDDSSQH